VNAGWGPFPELARQLGGAAPGLERAEDLGGLWGLPIPGWPATLPVPRPQPRPPASFRELASQSLRWLLHLRSAAARPIDPEELTRLLLRCHLWLGLRNLRSIAPLFGPGAEDLPAGVFTVSPKALAWTLLAMDFAERGRGTPLPPARYAPGAGDPPGDALSLHLHVEDLVERAASRLRISPSPAPPWRQPGGLRKASFLRAYPLLEQLRRGPMGSWKQAIDAFIAASPLTQLVYLDILGKLPAPELLDGLLRPGRPTPTAPGFDPEVGWRELWLSLLARSLAGAVLSPPPLEERWRAAEARERGPAATVKPSAEAESAAALRSQLEEQYLQRLALLAGLVRPAADSGRAAPVYFHLRMLDMLVRHLVTASGEAMEEQWHSSGESSGRRRTFNALLGEGAAPGKALATALLGAREKPPSGQDWKGHLDAFLSPEVPGLEEMARQTGVARSSAGWLIERWSDDEGQAVELPFSPLYSQGWSPATLTETWKAQLVTVT
jgi:hypothetical protein